MKQMMVVNDLSGLGNCSLSANMAVFSAMGIQPCAVPTAVLTNQSCYSRYEEMPYQVSFSAYAAVWEQIGMTLSGIYSGYFRNPAQMEAMEAAFLESKGEIPYFNDPVMGDLGAQYDNCSNAMVDAMRRLVRHSVLTTPNLTELCLLSGASYEALTSHREEADYLERIASCAQGLLALGAKRVIVTGVKTGDKLYNILVDQEGASARGTSCLEGDYSGTGDLFSSIVSGSLLTGRTAEQAVETATGFIRQAIVYTMHALKNEHDGLYFYPFLKELADGGEGMA